MGDEDGSRELPQRSRGAARGGADRSAPVLSEEVRQRIQAAVRAERAGAVAQDNQFATEPAKPAKSAKRSANGVSATPKPATSKPATSKPATSKPATPKSATPKPATLEPATPKPATPKPAGAKPAPAEPESAQPEPSRRRGGVIRLIALVLVLVTVGALITVVSLHLAKSSRGTSGPLPAVLRQQEALTRSQAASWVTSQLNPDTMVACDAVMCQALRTDKYPAGEVVTLGPQSPSPVTSAVVVVVTEAVRELFGTSIESAFAPAVLTSIGSGAAQVTIRSIAAHGALAYQDQLTAGQAARASYGKVLLANPRIKLSGTAGQQLASGQVDARLAVAIAALGGAEPISILRFGNVGSGASAGVPLRYADLATTDSAASLTGTAYLRALQARLSRLGSQYRPASSQIVGHVFRVAFTAPSPLGAVRGP